MPALSNSQQAAADKMLETPGVSILCGGPGTGKTFTVAQIIRDLQAEGGHRIMVAAPTGKAARRLREQFKEHGITMSATTVHSMLGVEQVSDAGWVFRHGPHNPLPANVVIVDEFSMVSTSMAATLFGAIYRGTKVICVGDVHQLPPVEHGAPLRDMIASKRLPVAMLTEVRRNSGQIVHTCQAIRENGRFPTSRNIDYKSGDNLFHIEKSDPRTIRNVIKLLMQSVPEEFDALRDVQVITSLRDKGNLSCESLNSFIRDVVNPNGFSFEGCDIRDGDKIMCRKNKSFDEVYKDGSATGLTVPVANGEMGRCTNVAKGEIMIQLDDGQHIVVKGGDRNLWDLAYAITVHKSQGSQWPIVIYISDEHGGARRLNSRELVYTAISRAQKLTLTIGKLSTIQRDLRRISIFERKTFLRELLCA